MFKLVKRINIFVLLLGIAFLVVEVLFNLYLPTLTAEIINNGVVTGDTSYIWSKGIVILLFTVISVAAAVVNTFIASKVAYKLSVKLREEIYIKAIQFSQNEFDKIGTSSLVTRNTFDVMQVQKLVELVMKFLIMGPLYLIGGIALAWRLSSDLTMIFIYAMPVLLLVAIGISLQTNPLFAMAQKKIDSMNRIYREGLNGVKVIRAFNKEQMEYSRYKEANEDYTKVSIKVNTLTGLLVPLITLVMCLATALITWIGGKGASHGAYEIGTIMGVVAYSTQITVAFGVLTSIISAIPRGIISAKRINEILEMPLTITDTPNPQKSNRETSLAFQNVSFHYQGSEKNALENISFQIKSGQTFAVVGSTGAGKSTLISLMLRLYDTTDGNVILNGTNLTAIPQSDLHNRVSYVPQKSTLFFGTIRDNLLLARPDATDEEIWTALHTANASEFVKALDKGLDSQVDKAGGNFSGGQKQRLCIARALLKKADVYIFDDSFSALDFKTDAFIREALKTPLKDAVKIIVAQRIGTIMDADCIAVLSAGRLTGLGTHEQLKEHNQIYREILHSQFGTEVAV